MTTRAESKPLSAGVPGTVPIAAKVLYTAFMCVLIPKYLIAYGPTNFLYFCDIALFFTLFAVWKEWSLPISASAVGILLPQTVWIVDFLGGLSGHHLTGMTEYMFNPELTLFTRFLSFFHFWLPLFLLYLMSRLGYDRRAGPCWVVLAWAVLVVCYLYMPAPPRPPGEPGLPVNINYVFGPSGNAHQAFTTPNRYFALLVTVLTFLVYLPTHFLLRRVFPEPARASQPPV